jgi:replication factor C subunit 3/5
MLWVDKHRPVALDKFELHADTAGQLASLTESGECPHLLVYGPPGAGKKTLVLALLRQLFGPGADKLKVRVRVRFLPPAALRMRVVDDRHNPRWAR